MVADEVITTSELLTIAGTDRIRIIDARESEAYAEGHIPGAVSLHPSALEHTEVQSTGEDVPHQLRSATEVSAFFRAAGINNDVQVCVYDDGGGYLAARIWWALDLLGHSRCRLLDGGLFAWTATGGALTRESEPLSDGRFVYSPRPERRLEFSDVIAAMGDPRTVLCNSLPADQFWVGSIPGSINIPYTDTFASDNHPLLRTRHELEALFLKHAVTPEHRLICYCQIGYSACQLYFAARYAGLNNVAVYDGSMLDWAAHGGDLYGGSGETE